MGRKGVGSREKAALYEQSFLTYTTTERNISELSISELKINNAASNLDQTIVPRYLSADKPWPSCVADSQD